MCWNGSGEQEVLSSMTAVKNILHADLVHRICFRLLSKTHNQARPPQIPTPFRFYCHGYEACAVRDRRRYRTSQTEQLARTSKTPTRSLNRMCWSRCNFWRCGPCACGGQSAFCLTSNTSRTSAPTTSTATSSAFSKVSHRLPKPKPAEPTP